MSKCHSAIPNGNKDGFRSAGAFFCVAADDDAAAARVTTYFIFFTKSRNKNLKYEPELIDAGQVHRNHPNIFSQIKPERDWNKYF